MEFLKVIALYCVILPVVSGGLAKVLDPDARLIAPFLLVSTAFAVTVTALAFTYKRTFKDENRLFVDTDMSDEFNHLASQLGLGKYRVFPQVER